MNRAENGPKIATGMAEAINTREIEVFDFVFKISNRRAKVHIQGYLGKNLRQF